jgi:hypothetical protein
MACLYITEQGAVLRKTGDRLWPPWCLRTPAFPGATAGRPAIR